MSGDVRSQSAVHSSSTNGTVEGIGTNHSTIPASVGFSDTTEQTTARQSTTDSRPSGAPPPTAKHENDENHIVDPSPKPTALADRTCRDVSNKDTTPVHMKMRTSPVTKPTVFIVDVESSPAALEFCDGITSTYFRHHVARHGHRVIVVHTRSYKRLPPTFKIPAPKNALITQLATNDCSPAVSFFATRTDLSKSIRIVASAKMRGKYVDILHLMRERKHDIELLPPDLKLYELIGVPPPRSNVKSSKRLATKLSYSLQQSSGHPANGSAQKMLRGQVNNVLVPYGSSQESDFAGEGKLSEVENGEHNNVYPSTSQITIPSTESSQST
eukprot:gb/GECG01003124.1/.p1 GENE.gb/GECG01003124.1/~~gb/GECG01003124.1/.p1  ORF type:complete len:328 (+),score=31.67 gb/GECG01003124.1/:1-984(+)